MPYYAVAIGRKRGIYQTWDECKSHVDGHKGSRYKKFKTEVEAQSFIDAIVSSNKPVLSATSVPFAPISKVRSRSSAPISKVQPVVQSTIPAMFNTSSSAVLQPAAGSRKRKFSDGAKYKSDALTKFARIEVDSSTTVVYTDGACSSNGRREAKAGVGVFWDDNHVDNVAEPLLLGPHTNNRAEYQAVVRALEIAKIRRHISLQVRTDSNLLVKSMNQWMPSWKRNGWKTSKGESVKNRDLLEKIDSLRKEVQVSFVHINGHVGIYGNEKADELARQGALM